jgi:CRP-like cAMP-binding protein
MVSLELLRRFPFFSFMEDKELKAVAMIAQDLHPKANDVLIEADKPADALFFLVEGHLPYYMVVTTEHMPDYRREYFVGYINPNEIFGISALIEPYKYTAILRAETPSRIIKIEAPALRALCEVDVHLSIGLMKSIAKTAMERLQMTRVQLVAESMKAEEKPTV